MSPPTFVLGSFLMGCAPQDSVSMLVTLLRYSFSTLPIGFLTVAFTVTEATIRPPIFVSIKFYVGSSTSASYFVCLYGCLSIQWQHQQHQPIRLIDFLPNSSNAIIWYEQLYYIRKEKYSPAAPKGNIARSQNAAQSTSSQLSRCQGVLTKRLFLVWSVTDVSEFELLRFVTI